MNKELHIIAYISYDDDHYIDYTRDSIGIYNIYTSYEEAEKELNKLNQSDDLLYYQLLTIDITDDEKN